MCENVGGVLTGQNVAAKSGVPRSLHANARRVSIAFQRIASVDTCMSIVQRFLNALLVPRKMHAYARRGDVARQRLASADQDVNVLRQF